MSKTLDCVSEPGRCSFRATGETDVEVVERAAAHAKNDHGAEITPDLVERMRAAIRES
jgi:predicted small metal-binding protein